MVSGCDLVPASADASFRRYFRLQKGGESFIVMDAPPPEEDCQPFVTIAGYLRSMGLSAPRVLEADLKHGFLLLSDLGSDQYLDRLEADESSADRLYADAIAALLRLQRRGEIYQEQLPPYDEEQLKAELALFRDWLCGTHLNLEFSAADEAAWQSCCDLLSQNSLQQTQVFVHRDFHSRNLMILDAGNPGILDFQDAMEGALTYDLVSLLKDCYISWPADRVREWALSFYSQLHAARRANLSESTFIKQFELMGVQRQLKAAGIFCRLKHRDGKSGYLKDVPRTLAYILEVAPRHAALEFLQKLISERIAPAWDAHS